MEVFRSPAVEFFVLRKSFGKKKRVVWDDERKQEKYFMMLTGRMMDEAVEIGRTTEYTTQDKTAIF